MSVWEDFTGRRFGQLVCLNYVKGRPYSYWNCLCDCGNEKLLKAGNLKSGETKSCGCKLKALHYSRKKDLAGQQFGRWTALRCAGVGSSKWVCQCQCGNQSMVLTESLIKGTSKSCGCYKKDRGNKDKIVDISGQRFGSLVAMFREPSTNSRRSNWRCLCDCGDTKSIYLGNLRSGATTSCGCRKAETISWNQRKRMTPEALRSLYIYCHPELKNHYKIGIAVKPKYRSAPCYGSLVYLDAVQGHNEDVAKSEKVILKRTSHLNQCPEDMQKYAGVSEWRVGEEAVRIWHEEASKLAKTTN